jgi:hypothetical protein
MNLDIRVPIGLLFLTLGGLLTGFGVVTHFSNPAIYARSLDININIWWGLAMLVFGAAMFHYGRRATTEAVEVSQNP